MAHQNYVEYETQRGKANNLTCRALSDTPPQTTHSLLHYIIMVTANFRVLLLGPSVVTFALSCVVCLEIVLLEVELLVVR